MAFWFALMLWAASFAASELIAIQTAKDNSKKLSKLGDFAFPTATEERRIPWLWGKVKQSGPNVLWYGNLRQKAKKVASSVFSETTVGYHYYLSIQFGLCKGPAVLRKVWYGETLVWSGTQAVEGDIDINKPPQMVADPHWPTWVNIVTKFMASIPTIVRPYDLVPSGVLHFHPGDLVQDPDDFLELFQTPCPAYRGLCYCTFDGYIGESTSPEPWSFEMERIPDGLNLTLALGTPKVGTEDDANPMNVAYEIFTEVYGYAATDVDAAGTWTAAATTLLSEGNGFSWMKDSPDKASVVIQELEKQIGGHFYLDPVTGQWKVELVRADYDIDDLPELNEDNVTECSLFSRGTWTGSTNEVYIEFNNRGNDYKDSSAKAQDLANMAIQGKRISTTMAMAGVRTPALAGDVAWRELQMLSYPLAIARVKTNRSMWNGYRGMAVKYNYDVDAPIAMRITKINSGNTENGPIEIDLVQDVFSSVSSAFSTPSTGWTPPVVALYEFTNQKIVEAPHAIVLRGESTDPTRLWVMAADQFDGATGMNVEVDGTAAGKVNGLTPLGVLDGDITQETTTIDIFVDNVEVSQFVVATATAVGQSLVNLIMIGDELIAPTSVVSTVDGLQLVGCYRGLCDTVQAMHVDGEDVWITCLGAGLNDQSLSPGDTVDVKLIPSTAESAMASGDITAVLTALNYREDRPYPPSLLSLNASLFPASVDIDSGVTLTFNRRDWRIFDEVSQLAVDAETLDPTFPAADTTQYKVVLYVSGVEVYAGVYNAGTASLAITLLKILRYCVGCPAVLEIGVRTRHSHVGTLASLQDLQHEATVTSVLTDDFFLGILDTYQTSPPWTAPADGNYDFTLSAVLDADLQVKVNGGALATVVAAGLTTGTLNGVVTGDIIEVRHLDSTTLDEVLLTIDAPTCTTDAYAVLIFEDVYWMTGGLGRLGFGTGPFGR
jgi:hypothetical protein